ncbi:16S rRNA (cytosine(967)-C(5))-methyltransferase RsmB [Pontiella agarivorans]|uniref:16S rRNA (cytosine(967)-C(5))-methyltransferase n=1 Tax=Pontiella agarivorans TaxID=3038953 RepID=A0ABU5MVL6_9BACT|nr:16S rRNA (cytosine(967)-C(5))-methyltransferase RsmB [Pontiella agarivorans]MDZ8118281.1 16S rRNA (cytosine(967)-C(5))-methyltransferase RsmB [Pontiella agarivorans]
MKKQKNSRLIAAEIVFQWLEHQDFPDRSLAKLKQDHAFILEVVNGVVRNRLKLQWLETKWVKNEPKLIFKAILWVGLYQILFMKVEDYAAINETVQAAKERPGGLGPAKLINAILRRAQREKDDLFKSLESQPDYIRLSHPEFLMERWKKTYGEADAVALAEWNNEPPSTILRIEQSAVDAAEFIDKLREADIEPLLHPYSDKEIFLVLPRGIPVKKVPGYDEGWFTVQDPATSVSVDLLAPRPGETVLDACAAPGGKTAMIAGRMDRRGELVAMDLHDDRIRVLEENKKRLKLDWIATVKGDARKPQAVFSNDRKFDAILLDVPCLNTGVFKRRADARWRVTEERIETITKLQYEILTACSELLAEKGRLVYSTCSLEPEENEELVTRWIANHSGFRLVKTGKAFPPDSGTDGAFAALIRKK